MRIAIIGCGISGLTAAWSLQHSHQITLFEQAPHAGGHTDTHQITVDGRDIHVDTGFIVFNHENYPNFSRLLDALGVESQPSDMSFSVVHEGLDLVYGAAGLRRLLARPANLFRPDFLRMLRDLRRFYREASALLDSEDDTLTLGDYLEQNGYSKAFCEGHILPMAAALWSASIDFVRRFPARYFVAFMANHRMLQIAGRPQWRTIRGGSSCYVEALLNKFHGRIFLNTPVRRVSRDNQGVTLHTDDATQRFDGVIFACHSDQALAILEQPTPAEREVLGAIGYANNHVALHSDERLLPPQRAAWASWNVRVREGSGHGCQVNYWMNLLQDLPVTTPVIVSLNARDQIDPDKIWLERTYAHPQYTTAALNAQRRHAQISGSNHTWYCGAYWGWGFHEDGVRSGLKIAEQVERYSQHVAA